MPDDTISIWSIKKGKLLEGNVFQSIARIILWLASYGIIAEHRYSLSRGGRGNRSVDHIVMFDYQGRSYRIYIEDKNWNNRPVNQVEFHSKFLGKFDKLILGVDNKKRTITFAFIVGHARLGKKMLDELKSRNIEFVSTDEFSKDDANLSWKIQSQLTSRLARCIAGIIGDLSSKYFVFIKNLDVIEFRGITTDEIDISAFEASSICYLNYDNPFDYFEYLRSRRKGGLRKVISPWKLRCVDPRILVRHRRHVDGRWVSEWRMN